MTDRTTLFNATVPLKKKHQTNKKHFDNHKTEHFCLQI